jgi:hypothetical protein
MRLNIYDLWVVTSDMAYCNTSVPGDEAFTEKAEAETSAVALRESAKVQFAGSSTTVTYSVKTLSDFIRDVRDDARSEAQRSLNETPSF